MALTPLDVPSVVVVAAVLLTATATAVQVLTVDSIHVSKPNDLAPPRFHGWRDVDQRMKGRSQHDNQFVAVLTASLSNEFVDSRLRTVAPTCLIHRVSFQYGSRPFMRIRHR